MLKTTLLYIKQGLNALSRAFSPVIIIGDHIYRLLFTLSYLEAAQFATRVHDYNLQSSSQLGMMLLNIKYGQDIDADLLRTIITNTHKIELIINYNYSLYVKYIVANEPIPKELLTYWEQMQYSDLLLFSSKIKSEKCDIKLTVM